MIERADMSEFERRLARVEQVSAGLIGLEARRHFGREMLEFALEHTPEE